MTPIDDAAGAAPRGGGSRDGDDDAGGAARDVGDAPDSPAAAVEAHHANAAGVSAPASSPAGFGAERCPAVWVRGATPSGLGDVAPVTWADVSRADEPRTLWRVAGYVDDPTDPLLDADGDDGALRATVYGTRVGDRWSGPVDLDKLGVGPGGVWSVALKIGPTGGTIYRWHATGCLACRDGRVDE